MSSPSLAQLLEAHGDRLAQLALLLAASPAAAKALLLGFARTLRQQPDIAALSGEARLVALATASPEPRGSRRQRGLAVQAQGEFLSEQPPLMRRILQLPVAQRALLLGHLIWGYDWVRMGTILAKDAAAAHAEYEQAIRALAPMAGATLSDFLPSAECQLFRDALVSPDPSARRRPQWRAHRAMCADCRQFEQQRDHVIRAAETLLRAILRPIRLDPALAHAMLRAAQPLRERFQMPRWQLFAAVGAIAAVIATLVLPGFVRQPQISSSADQGPQAVDPIALLQLAQNQLGQPPGGAGVGVWHAVFESVWYFDRRTYAPIEAEIWIERNNPARHRLQVSHADGGAPYELQVTNGRDRLWYAIDQLYAPSLYGDLARFTPGLPTLSTLRATPEQQAQSRTARFSAGVWSLPATYLSAAQQASDLRTLGRQRAGNRTLQILSYRGISPLSDPLSDPLSTTVLLAIDQQDGLLYSVTEVGGADGTAQTSRMTWRLLREEWIAASSLVDRVFNPQRAWSGIGGFPERPSGTLQTPRLPIVPAEANASPLLLSEAWAGTPLWLPASPPAGSDEVVIFWPDQPLGPQPTDLPPLGVAFLGGAQQLFVSINDQSQPPPAEALIYEYGFWQVQISQERHDRTRLFLRRPALPASASANDPSRILVVDGFGYNPSELLALIEFFLPFEEYSATNYLAASRP